MSEHPKAVCLLWPHDGHVLAVSRKHDPTQFGLPGGKVDPGEAPDVALAREVEEETRKAGETKGATVSGLVPVFTRDCPGDVTYVSTTYYAATTSSDIPKTPYVNAEGAVVDWVTPERLVEGPFGEYNRALFDRVGIPYKK